MAMASENLSRRQELNMAFHQKKANAERTRRGKLEFTFIQDWADDAYPTGGWKAWFARRLAPQEVAYLERDEVQALLRKENESERKMNTDLQALWRVAPPVGIRERFIEKLEPMVANSEPSVDEEVIEVESVEDVNRETRNNPEFVPTWVWGGYKKEERTIENTGDQIFDETRFTPRVIAEKPEGGYRLEPQSNQSLEKFIEAQARKIGRGRPEDIKDDILSMTAFLIENQIGPHVKVMSGASISVGHRRYRLLRAEPRPMHLDFKSSDTFDIRGVFTYDKQGIIFREFLNHDDFDRKYGSRKTHGTF